MTSSAPRDRLASRVALSLLAAVVLSLLVALVVASQRTAGGGDHADLVLSAPVSASAPRVGTVSGTAPGSPLVAASTQPALAPSWVRVTSRESGVPAVALAAYARAQLLSPASCRLSWTSLAGIGWVESQNGTLGGRTLEADGRSSSPILGPALDGTHHTQAIPSTAETVAYHGDPRWDHAVGPLQFIPSTWEQWGADGDGDGVEDPGDIDDAALAAAHYLCADGHDLGTAEGWTSAVLSYNDDASYLEAVHAAATSYAERTARG